jgi:pimeloyl-ACP methyl ester carboxylesterase/DNA-binding SARP family transcriptional activator
MPHVTIDGVEHEVEPAGHVLDLLEALGHDVPSACSDPRLEPAFLYELPGRSGRFAPHLAHMPMRVHLFGTVELGLGARRLGPRDFGGRKQKQTLEILLVHLGEPVPKDRIADLLWGDHLPRDPFRVVESYVSTLRARIDPDAARARRIVVTEPGAYRFALDDAELDVRRFDSLTTEARQRNVGDRHSLLLEAHALVRGDLLADEPYAEWAFGLRDLYRERSLHALVDAAEDLLASGRAHEALARAEAAMHADPSRERAHRIAIAAHATMGDQDLALRAYDRCRATLDAELGVVPSSETERLYLRIVNDEALPRPAPALPPRIGIGAAPRTRYAVAGGGSVAYQVVGTGELDLVYAPGSWSHVEATWEEPRFAAFLRRLAEHHRVLLFDKRGVGMSDPAPPDAALDDRADDIRAVMDAAGSDRAVVFGVSEGGPMGVSLAARMPERVAGLVLFGPFGRLAAAPDYPWGWTEDFFAAFKDAVDIAWATGRGVGLANPSVHDDDEFAEWVGRYFRLAASPATARAMLDCCILDDVRHQLLHVGAPTLVLQRREATWVRPENGRFVADHIPGAQLVELPGADDWPWLGDADSVLAATEEFLERRGV